MFYLHFRSLVTATPKHLAPSIVTISSPSQSMDTSGWKSKAFDWLNSLTLVFFWYLLSFHGDLHRLKCTISWQPNIYIFLAWAWAITHRYEGGVLLYYSGGSYYYYYYLQTFYALMFINFLFIHLWTETHLFRYVTFLLNTFILSVRDFYF